MLMRENASSTGPLLITASKNVLDTALVDGRLFRQDLFAVKGENS